jgi:hypothetical protein
MRQRRPSGAHSLTFPKEGTRPKRYDQRRWTDGSVVVDVRLRAGRDAATAASGRLVGR